MNRFRAHMRAHVRDHAYVRILWTNLSEFFPGVWRSNQPSPMRIRRMARRGIKTVISLRGLAGALPGSSSLAEAEARKRGLAYATVRLTARKAPQPERLLELLDLFESVEKPVLLHCKSGADRTGIAAALWLLHMEQATVAEARQMLHWRYAHLSFLRSGIQGFLLDSYAADCEVAPMPIRDWIATRYDPETLTHDFAARRRGAVRSHAVAT